MFVKHKNSKPSVSQFNLLEQGSRPANEVDMLVESLQRPSYPAINNNSTSSNTPLLSNANAPRDLFGMVSNLFSSQHHQVSEHSDFSEPKMSHRDSRAHEFKKKTLAKENHLEVLQQDGNSRARELATQVIALSKKVETIETIQREVRHNAEEVDKRYTEQNKRLSKEVDSINKEFTQALKKMVKQINLKFLSIDKVSEAHKAEIDQLKEEGFRSNECQEGWNFQSSRPEPNILYGLDVKSSMDRLHLESPHNQQLLQLNEQLELLKIEMTHISKNTQSLESTKSREEYDLLKVQLQNISLQLSKGTEFKLSEYERVLQSHDENIQKINQEFQKVINEQISPKITSIEEAIRKPSPVTPTEQASKKVLEELVVIRDQLSQRLKHSEVLHVRKASLKEKELIAKTSSLNLNDTYYLDQQNHLLDSKGCYILDEHSNRLSLDEDCIYFMSLHGLNILNIE